MLKFKWYDVHWWDEILIWDKKRETRGEILDFIPRNI